MEVYIGPDYDDAADEYEVDSIVAERKKGRGMQYLVKWKVVRCCISTFAALVTQFVLCLCACRGGCHAGLWIVCWCVYFWLAATSSLLSKRDHLMLSVRLLQHYSAVWHAMSGPLSLTCVVGVLSSPQPSEAAFYITSQV